MSEYDTDILLWSEHQAELLRRRASGDPANDVDLDWLNLAEEIESVGREQLHAVQSLLMRALVHMLKAQAWPESREVPHWQAEARLLGADAARRYMPSMRQRIDLAALYRQALRGLPASIDGAPPGPVPNESEATLDELLKGD